MKEKRISKNGVIIMKKKSILALLFSTLFLVGSIGFVNANEIPIASLDALVEQVYKAIPEDEMGGVYINNDGDLVICTTESYSRASSAAAFRGTGVNTLYKTVPRSLKELEAIKDKIVPFMLAFDIATIDANEVSNQVEIALYSSKYEKDLLTLLLDIVDVNAVDISILPNDISFSFTYATEPPVDTAKQTQSAALAVVVPIYPGALISVAISGGRGYFTAGPRYNDTYFLSSGHSCAANNIVYAGSSTTQCATVSSRAFGSSGDYSKIKVYPTTTSLPASGTFLGGTGTYSISTNGVVGTEVTMFGAYSDWTTGKITKTNQTISVDGVVVQGLTLASYTCQRGDSGAGVFSKNAFSTKDSKCYGIQSIGVFQGTSTTSIESYYSLASGR